MDKKKILLIGIIVVLIIIYLLINVLEKEMTLIEVVPDQSLASPMLAEEALDDPGGEKYDGVHAFFVEYRLERDRVRGQELELLNDLVNNTSATVETRREAEKQILQLVELMEKELIIENMLKAQGYADAIFFGGGNGATVMVHAAYLGEEEFWRIADMIAAITGFSRENLQVIQQR